MNTFERIFASMKASILYGRVYQIKQISLNKDQYDDREFLLITRRF